MSQRRSFRVCGCTSHWPPKMFCLTKEGVEPISLIVLGRQVLVATPFRMHERPVTPVRWHGATAVYRRALAISTTNRLWRTSGFWTYESYELTMFYPCAFSCETEAVFMSRDDTITSLEFSADVNKSLVVAIPSTYVAIHSGLGFISLYMLLMTTIKLGLLPSALHNTKQYTQSSRSLDSTPHKISILWWKQNHLADTRTRMSRQASLRSLTTPSDLSNSFGRLPDFASQRVYF